MDQKKTLIKIISACVILGIIGFFEISGILKNILYYFAYFIAGYSVLIEAFENIKEKELFDENFLMSIATIGAFLIGENLEAAIVMILYQIGELFQSYAVNKSRKNIKDLMDIRPDYANIEVDGKLEKVDPDKIKAGSVIIIKPGEKIPIDGEIISGDSTLNTSALTGESIPLKVKIGDNIQSGCVNLNGVLKVKTTKIFEESTASKILELVENASSLKSKSEKFISKFARIYTPIVCFFAISLIILGMFLGNFYEWFYRALTFLVISCPCALVISIPLSFFAGLGGAGRLGILIKGSNFLETLSKVKCIAFDKTGTLTRGVFDVTAVHPQKIDETRLLHLAAHVERYSTHPIADSLRRAYPNEADDCSVKDIKEIPGMGISANVNGEIVSVGNSKLMEQIKADWKPCHKTGTVIHVAINEKYAGHVVISDVVKENAKKAIKELKDIGIEEIVMLTGDSHESAKNTADFLDIKEFYDSLLPTDKVKKIEELMKKYFKRNSRKVAFVGDGINDAPVLARADIGIAMGAMGSDAAIEAADVVIMNDDPMKISESIKRSKNCMKIVNENIYISIGVKLLCLIFGAMGFADMWLAVFADVGVMVLAVLNAVRALF